MQKNTLEWFENLISKKYILPVLLFVFFILFRESIWNIYNQKVVDGILSKIKPHWLIDITIIALSLITVPTTIYLVFQKKRITNNIFSLIVIFFILFFYCRFFSQVYSYASYYWFAPLKYIDYYFLLFGSVFLIKIYDWRNKFEKPYYYNTPFLIDYPIGGRNEDIYKRADFAKLLAEKIQSELENKEAGSLAIGINGPWGAGKTSFTNLVKENIQFDNRIIIDYNPWRSASAPKIIEDFFELLIDELKIFDPALSSDISAYARSLTKIDENIITKSTEIISDYIFGTINKNESYKRVNNSISKLKKQLIIFIDDLDRLDINEIIEVLRLVRNTANFNNLAYVVTYDKGYVLEAVKRFNPYNYRSFLEKIFQFEFLLPGFDNAITRNGLKGLLKEGLNPQYFPIITAAVDYAGPSGKNITAKVLRNNRDILRFSNSILFEIKHVIDEVNFIDFYLIQLLKLKFTAIYKLLADNFEIYFIQENGQFRFRTLSEKDVSEQILSTIRLLKEQNKSKEPEEKTSLFEVFIRSNLSENYTELEKDTILEIVDLLLHEKDLRLSSASKDFKSFVYSRNFNTYFNIKVLESSFTAKEFEEFRYDNFEKYKDVVFRWIKKGRISDVQEKLEKIIDFSTKQEWINHWKLLIEIARYQHEQSGVYGINYREIIDVLNYPDKPKGKGHLLFNDRGEYVNFIWDIFENAQDPYIIEGSILASALTPYVKLPFDDKKIEDQLLAYFKKYCNNHEEVTEEFRQLHKNAVRKSDTYGRDFEIQVEAQELFKRHFLAYLTGSQLSGFIKHTQSGEDYFNIDYEWVKTFFNEPVYENLEDYLERAENIKKEKKHYNEFMDFYDKFRANNHKPVEFAFKHLMPSLWTGGTKSNPTV